MPSFKRGCCVVFVLLLVSACGGSSTSPSTTNLTGAWATNSNSLGTGAVTEQVTQSGSAFSGTYVGTATGQGVTVTYVGTVSGTINGSSVTFSTRCLWRVQRAR